MKNVKLENKEKIYIVYDWIEKEVKVVTYDLNEAYSKIGKDAMAGIDIEDYRLKEINLDDLDEVEE